MTSDSVAGILGWLFAAVALGMAVIYGPIGQFGKPSRPPAATTAPAAAPVAPAPATKGPVIREVPN